MGYLRLWVAVVCLVPAAWAPAQTTVYRTVDDAGVVTFSDTPPPQGTAVETMVIDLPEGESNTADQTWLDAMRETTDRMAADRREREKHRAELRKLQAESQPPTQVVVEEQDDYWGYPLYYGRPGWRPGGGHRPRPGHPVARPPLRPPGSSGPPQAQPYQPDFDYPASLIRKGYSPEVRRAMTN